MISALNGLWIVVAGVFLKSDLLINAGTLVFLLDFMYVLMIHLVDKYKLKKMEKSENETNQKV